jgi:hypothetical protein
MDQNEKKPDKEWNWTTDILASYPSGVDITQLEERLKLTPTERLERMRRFLEFLESAKQQRAD